MGACSTGYLEAFFWSQQYKVVQVVVTVHTRYGTRVLQVRVCTTVVPVAQSVHQSTCTKYTIVISTIPQHVV